MLSFAYCIYICGCVPSFFTLLPNYQILKLKSWNFWLYALQKNLSFSCMWKETTLNSRSFVPLNTSPLVLLTKCTAQALAVLHYTKKCWLYYQHENFKMPLHLFLLTCRGMSVFYYLELLGICRMFLNERLDFLNTSSVTLHAPQPHKVSIIVAVV